MLRPQTADINNFSCWLSRRFLVISMILRHASLLFSVSLFIPNVNVTITILQMKVTFLPPTVQNPLDSSITNCLLSWLVKSLINLAVFMLVSWRFFLRSRAVLPDVSSAWNLLARQSSFVRITKRGTVPDQYTQCCISSDKARVQTSLLFASLNKIPLCFNRVTTVI